VFLPEYQKGKKTTTYEEENRKGRSLRLDRKKESKEEILLPEKGPPNQTECSKEGNRNTTP